MMGMRRLLLGVVGGVGVCGVMGVVGVASTAACGIDVTGSAPIPAASVIVAPTPTPDAGTPCSPEVEVVDALTTGLDTLNRWKLEADASNVGYPRIEPSPFGVAALSLLRGATSDARGGLWLRERVPTQAFDISLSFFIGCDACADGLAVAWLEALDLRVTDNANTGRSFGLPRAVRGGAAAIDLYQNAETGDGTAPGLQLLDLDGVRDPGTYGWTKAALPVPGVTKAEHKLELRARKGDVEARIDGGPSVKARVKVGFLEGLFGITAATGGDTARFFVRNLDARFYRCDP
jgi:hypothetical protein